METLLKERGDLVIPIGTNLTTYLDKSPEYPDRIILPDDQINWSLSPKYNPASYVNPKTLELVHLGADEEEPDFTAIPNRSLHFTQDFRDGDLVPRHPYGRTGLVGRGMLWLWGANQAADGVVTRVSNGNLELLKILRQSGEPAFPGGFIDKGEEALGASIREVFEETKITLQSAPIMKLCSGLFIPSSRTTDNAWIETSAFHWHLEGAEAQQEPVASDDALDAEWTVIDQQLIQRIIPGHRVILEALLRSMN